jgi:hypothetical protein
MPDAEEIEQVLPRATGTNADGVSLVSGSSAMDGLPHKRYWVEKDGARVV